MDVRKLKDRAAQLAENGKLVQAAAIYQELAEAEPRNAHWPQKVGEIQRKRGQKGEAVESFAEAARRFAEDGFLVKAIALCKVILGMSPNHTATQAMLARLYASTGTATGLPAIGSAGIPTGLAPAIAGIPTGVAPAVASPAPPARSARSTPTPVRPVTPPPVPPEPMPRAAVSAPASGQAPAPARKRVGHKTIPPGAALDAVELRSLLPEERRPRRGSVEIPLNEEAALLSRETRGASALRLPKVPLFSQLNEPALRDLIERVSVRHYSPGDRIITEGELGESLYVLAEGEVVVLHERPKRVEVRRLEEGAFFGEIALLTHLPRSATVEAASNVTALEVSREVMAHLINEHPTVLRVMLRFFRDRLIATLLETSEIFAPFAPDARRELLSRFTFLECAPGDGLIREGEPADGLYILLCGKLEARRDGSATAQLDAGSVIGERSLLGGGPEEASIVGLTKCWALKLDRSAFSEMIMTHPTILEYLSELESRRPGDSHLTLV